MAAVIAYRDYVDDATLSGAATIVSGFPVSNVQSRQLSSTTRISTSGTPEIIVDLGATRVVRLVSMLGINARFSAANNTTIEYRATPSAPWQPVAVTWPTDGGAASRLELAREVAPALHCVIEDGPADGGINARQIRIVCGWGPATGETYYEIGRLWVSDALVLPAGVDGTWSMGFREPGKLDVSAGLQAYESPRARPRVLRCSLSKVSTLDAYGFVDGDTVAFERPSLQGLQMYAGTTGEVIVLPRTSSPLWTRRIGVYGHVAQEFDIQHIDGGWFRADGFAVEEER